MTATTEADLEILRAEIAGLRSDLSKITETLRDIVHHGSGEAYDRVKQSAERAREEAMKTAERVTREIEERPLTAALTAFSVGVILGMLFGRRS